MGFKKFFKAFVDPSGPDNSLNRLLRGMDERRRQGNLIGGNCPVCGFARGTAMHATVHAEYLRQHQPKQQSPPPPKSSAPSSKSVAKP